MAAAAPATVAVAMELDAAAGDGGERGMFTAATSSTVAPFTARRLHEHQPQLQRRAGRPQAVGAPPKRA